MAEYIDREALLADFSMTDYPWTDFDDAWEMVQNAPAADVAPVKHGKWIRVDETKCRCGRCEIITLIALYPHGEKNYCPQCGAKMDL